MTPLPARRSRFKLDLPTFLDFAALSGFAIAQPVFGVLAGSADYLVFTDAGGLWLVSLAFAVAVIPPVALWLANVAGAALSPRLGALLHSLLVGGLLTVVVLQALRAATSLGVIPSLVSAVSVGALLTLVHARWRPAQLWMRLASPAPLVFGALFLFASPVSGLLRTADSTPVVPGDGEMAAPVILMVFDEFPLLTLLTPGGEIDERLFPNLAALAGEATFFRNATSVAARTAHAVPAILTGRFPRADAAPTRSQHPENLFALLQSSHRIHAFESITSLCPRAACPRNTAHEGSRWRLFHDAIRIWVGTVTPGVGGENPLGTWFSGEPGDEPSRFRRFVASIDGEGTPFHFLHLILPHAPWQFLPSGLQYPPRDLGLVDYDERTGEGWPALVDRQRHVLQAMYVDRLVGETVARLKEVGLYERSTLLVTSDHGISFQPGLSQGTRNLGPTTAHEIAWVPFVLKSPGQTLGVVSDDNVMTVDVAPTLAELAGRRLPWQVDGMSLATAPARNDAKVWFNHPGDPIHINGHDAYPKVLSGVVQGLAQADEGAEGMFKMGPFAHMVGTAPADYMLGHEGGAVGTVDDLWSYDSVDIATGTVPALVSGYLDLSPEGRPPAGVAIVLNGTIAAVSELYGEGGQAHRFAALVSPRWLQQGTNVLELFLVGGEGHENALRPVEIDRLAR